MSAIHSHYKQCKRYMNRNVVITTKHGTYRGKIVKVDGQKVYLQSAAPWTNSKKASISFFPFILPLVLFDLLAIALITTRPRFF